MKELNDDIDHIFQDSLGNEEVFPSEKAWETLDAKLDKRELSRYKQKITRYRILTLSLALLLILSGGYQFLVPYVHTSSFVKSDHPSFNSNNSGISTSSKTVTSTSPITDVNSNAVNDKNIITETSRTPRSNHRGNRTSQTLTVPATHVNIASKANPSSGSSIPVSGSSSERATPNSINTVASPVSETPVTEGQITSTIPTMFPTKYPDLIPTETSTSIAISTETPNPSSTSASSSTSTPTSTIPAVLPLKSRFSLAVLFTPEVSSHLLTADHDSDHDTREDGDDNFSEREKDAFSYTAAVKVGYDLNKHWTVFSGINYSSYSQKITPSVVYPEQATDGKMHYTLSTSAGDASLPNVSGQNLVSKDSLSLRSFSTESLRFISVPVTLQYTIAVKKISIHVYAGASLDYLIGQTVEVEMPNIGGQEQLCTVTSLEGIHRVNMGFHMGLGAQYQFSKHYSLLLDPSFRGSLTPINYNTPVKSYPYAYGLSLGLAYHF